MKETFLLRLFFAVYQLVWLCVTPFLIRSTRIKDGAAERTLQEINFAKADLWIHAASVGEAYLARQLVQGLGNERQLDILITTNTLQGKSILEKDFSESGHRIIITYMVFDNPSFIKKAVEVIDPELLVLIELEIWPALMAEMKRRGKKIIIVNGRMTEKSFNGYKKIGSLWKALKPDIILAISKEDKTRFTALFDLDTTYHVANMKFDRMEKCQIATERQSERLLLVMASIRREEEPDILYLIEQLLEKFPELEIGLFPRHMHRVESWTKMLSEKKISWILKSTGSGVLSCSVVIWDVFGELINAYRRADTAFVGGSLAPLGGQNFIEAFMNGVVPVTGPSNFNFLWAGDEVIRDGLVRKGNTREEVLQLLVDSLETPVDKSIIQQKADNYIGLKQGGSSKTCQYIVALLEESK
jgi:3-deoxy-D-manno-octulosonic-acid transferase